MKHINVKKLHPEANLPTRAHDSDAGLDLYAAKSWVIDAGHNVSVGTDIAVEIPHGYVGLIYDRSSVSSRGLKVVAGVIDSGYFGELTVVLHNINSRGFCDIRRGDRIAQLLILPIASPEVVEVEDFLFKEGSRGDKGFGSTGA